MWYWGMSENGDTSKTAVVMGYNDVKPRDVWYWMYVQGKTHDRTWNLQTRNRGKTDPCIHIDICIYIYSEV